MVGKQRLQAHGRARDRGAGTVEYVGMTVVAALLAGAVLTAVSDSGLPASLQANVDCILSAGEGCAPGGQAGGPSGAVGDGASGVGRRDTQRDAREDRRNRGDGDLTQPDPAPTGAPQPPIGAPVPGTMTNAPGPPPWEPVDPGAGEHGSKRVGLNDLAVEAAAEAGANAFAGSWPDASRNLLHFLGNSGQPLEQDVDKMLTDVPEFQVQVDRTAQSLIATAVARAQADGVTAPVTFPVSSDWSGFGYENGALVYDNSNWFYALGGWQSSQTGTITVFPPSEPGGQWRYSSSLTVHIQDQYNWDGGKQVFIGPLKVTDEQLAELHRKGLAQEFTATGQTTSGRIREGVAP